MLRLAPAALLGVVLAVLSPTVTVAADPDTNSWSPSGRSTYEGVWTLAEIGWDGEPTEFTYAEGDTRPGAVEVECTGDAAVQSCDFLAMVDDDGKLWWATTLQPGAGGALRSVTDAELDNCDGGQIYRTDVEVAFDAESATATMAELNIPRTCEDDGGVVYHQDETWTFEGTLATYVPPAGGAVTDEGDLGGYLTSYGLDCTTLADGATTCLMEPPDASYLVVTTTDEAGELSGINASVTSLDPSMPSDAGGFLRGVAERAPVDDTEALLSWFDQAIAGGDTDYAGEPWRAAWSDTATGGEAVWALSLLRDVAPEPSPTVAPAPAAPTEAPAATPTIGGAVGGGGPDEPRPFAASVPAPSDVATDPVVLLQSALLAALLVFLMPFPSQLFNSTLETHEDEVRRWLRLDRLGAAARGLGSFWASWPGVALFTGLAAVLYGFLDPGFGLDVRSLATFLGMLLGIVLVTVAFAVPTVLAHRRVGDRPSPAVVPVSLLIGVICVLISRLTNFQPGYLYGLLIGLAFARELSAAEEGRVTAAGAALMLGVAFVSWLALGVVPDGDGFALVVARTTLAALMVAGLEGVVFGLLPMRFLPGEALYRWNRLLWGGLLVVGAFAFFHILINPASGYLSDSSRTPLFTVIGLLLGFSLVSVAFWSWFRFRDEPANASQPKQEGVQ